MFKIYLPIFRVYIAFHLLKKLYFNIGSISIVFAEKYNMSNRFVDEFPILKANFIFEIPLIIQISILLSIFFGFGIFKNITTILLCLCNFILTDTFAIFGNGGDNFLYFIMIYMSFTNSYSYFSISKYNETLFTNMISNLGVYAILLHLCLIYFMSAIHKIHSDVWFNGVATYYILNLDRFCSPINYLFCKNAFFIAFSTYSTILFEIFFPVLVWFKKTKNYVLISGILMHLGIYFFMMIYDFEILFIMIYGFFITSSQWSVFLKKYKIKWIKV